MRMAGFSKKATITPDVLHAIDQQKQAMMAKLLGNR